MALIASVSGIRGTIGGKPGDNLTPEDIVRFTAAYATMIKQQGFNNQVVLGRDGRISGAMVQGLVLNTLLAMGMDVIDLGLTTTPTLEMAVPSEKAAGGIMLTASHNPQHWNALKLLNNKGEFISAQEGNMLLEIAKSETYEYAPVEQIGRHYLVGNYIDYHVNAVLQLPYVNTEAIRSRGFHVVVDAINSTGAIAIPQLLKALGVTYTLINHEVTGKFAHNPEPLPEHLAELMQLVVKDHADFGIAIDPDVDRLALVAEDGSWFGEEYTLVAAADHVLHIKPGHVVNNLSSSRALFDLSKGYGVSCFSAAVGEVHVVAKMKEVKAVIGGEGNGGVILPELHYGRDALVGVALILSLLSKKNISLGALRKTYPEYAISKQKVDLTSNQDWEKILDVIKTQFAPNPMNESDGLKVDLPEGWFHLRKSNTEPIIRIYAESHNPASATALANSIATILQNVVYQQTTH